MRRCADEPGRHALGFAWILPDPFDAGGETDEPANRSVLAKPN
jgi:hypothetical protein